VLTGAVGTLGNFRQWAGAVALLILAFLMFALEVKTVVARILGAGLAL